MIDQHVHSVEAYRGLKEFSTYFAGRERDRLHELADADHYFAAQTLLKLIRDDAWWGRPSRVEPAADALARAADRPQLFDVDRPPEGPARHHDVGEYRIRAL